MLYSMELSINLADNCPQVNLTFLRSEFQAPALSACYQKLYNTGKK